MTATPDETRAVLAEFAGASLDYWSPIENGPTWRMAEEIVKLRAEVDRRVTATHDETRAEPMQRQLRYIAPGERFVIEHGDWPMDDTSGTWMMTDAVSDDASEPVLIVRVTDGAAWWCDDGLLVPS